MFSSHALPARQTLDLEGAIRAALRQAARVRYGMFMSY